MVFTLHDQQETDIAFTLHYLRNMETMTPLTWLGIGFFITIMFATILISSLPRVTIKLLELLRLVKSNTLFHDKRNYVNGAGQHVYRGVYYSFRNGAEHFENMRVFLLLLAASVIPGGILLLLIYILG